MIETLFWACVIATLYCGYRAHRHERAVRQLTKAVNVAKARVKRIEGGE